MAESLSHFNRPFVFRRRPRDLPGDLRVVWRVALIVLILGECSRGQKASLKKLHALNWICYSAENRERFKAVIEGHSQPDDLIMRIEPSLNRAIEFAVGEHLAEWINGNRVKLTSHGKSFLESIKAGNECMLIERDFLKQIKSEATEASLERLLSWTKDSS